MQFYLKYSVANKNEGKRMNNLFCKKSIKTNYLYVYNNILNYSHK